MPKKIIHINQPKTGSEFRTIDGGEKKGGCPVYAGLEALKSLITSWIEVIQPAKTKPGKALGKDESIKNNGGKNESVGGIKKPTPPTKPTPPKIHKCPSYSDVLRQIDALRNKWIGLQHHSGESKPIVEKPIKK